MSTRHTPAGAHSYDARMHSSSEVEASSSNANVLSSLEGKASTPHPSAPSPRKVASSRSSPTRSPSRGMRARSPVVAGERGPPPGLHGRSQRSPYEPFRAASGSSQHAVSRGQVAPKDGPPGCIAVGGGDVTEDAPPLRDESSFIDNFFASGEALLAPTARPDGQTENARVARSMDSDQTAVRRHHHHRQHGNNEEANEAQDNDCLPRISGAGQASTSTSSSTARVSERTQSRFSSWFHDPPHQEQDLHSEREEDTSTTSSWMGNGRQMHLPNNHTSDSGSSWRRRPSDQPRKREERAADDTKSWRREPPGTPTSALPDDSSLEGHLAIRASPVSKDKDQQQRKAPRMRDRGKDVVVSPEDKTKKSSRRSAVAPPPGFASTAEPKRVNPPPGFAQDPTVTAELLPTATYGERVELHNAVEAEALAPVPPDLRGHQQPDHVDVPTQLPETSGPSHLAQAPHISTSSLPAPRATKGRSLKNYLPDRSNVKSLPSVAASLPLSFPVSSSVLFSPFPSLGGNGQPPAPYSAAPLTVSAAVSAAAFPPPQFIFGHTQARAGSAFAGSAHQLPLTSSYPS